VVSVTVTLLIVTFATRAFAARAAYVAGARIAVETKNASTSANELASARKRTAGPAGLEDELKAEPGVEDIEIPLVVFGSGILKNNNTNPVRFVRNTLIYPADDRPHDRIPSP
jgi:hypothetical protein